jgi:SAM-dependent methyltransferase
MCSRAGGCGKKSKMKVDQDILDNPETTLKRASIIRSKRLLRAFYSECYEYFLDSSSNVPPGIKLELGSGAGFIKEVMPDVITSEYLPLPTVDSVCSASDLPFPNRSLSAIFLLDVLHHLPDLDRFFKESNRCLLPGGVVAMVEPANTVWSRFIYRHFHPEPFDPTVSDWRLPPGGPLSMANVALPWIVFCRDRMRYDREYPDLEVVKIECFGPMLYVLSGGVTHRQMLPDLLYSAVRWGEELLTPLNDLFGMFMKITIRRRHDSPGKRPASDVSV